jgi:NADPH:quinone reductase-like Zn-dependent oxidoreductase
MTGGLIVSLAALRGADVLATAGPASRVQVMEAGAAPVVDYHDPDWPRPNTGDRGTAAPLSSAAPGVRIP